MSYGTRKLQWNDRKTVDMLTVWADNFLGSTFTHSLTLRLWWRWRKCVGSSFCPEYKKLRKIINRTLIFRWWAWIFTATFLSPSQWILLIVFCFLARVDLHLDRKFRRYSHASFWLTTAFESEKSSQEKRKEAKIIIGFSELFLVKICWDLISQIW